MYNNYYFPFESRQDLTNKTIFNLEKFYNKLQDDISKKIFTYRIMYSISQDYIWIRKIIDLMPTGEKLSAELDRFGKNGRIYIYGAGILGDKLFKIYFDKNWGAYIDKVKVGTMNNLPILKLNEIDKNSYIIISNYIGFRDIKEDLLRNGMREENIIVLKDYIKKSSENKYFEDACINNIKKGFFVDCGCYDGSNTINYINKYGLDHAVAIEADYKNYLICKQNLSNYSNVRVYNLGVSDKKEIKKFDMRASSASNFTDTGNVEVHTDTLDNLIGNESVGFIKMDIEGFEEKAIIGSQNIIRNQKPMLAVCMYHKREDFWRIPNILLELNEDYKFYLRHYSISANETILYCV